MKLIENEANHIPVSTFIAINGDCAQSSHIKTINPLVGLVLQGQTLNAANEAEMPILHYKEAWMLYSSIILATHPVGLN